MDNNVTQLQSNKFRFEKDPTDNEIGIIDPTGKVLAIIESVSDAETICNYFNSQLEQIAKLQAENKRLRESNQFALKLIESMVRELQKEYYIDHEVESVRRRFLANLQELHHQCERTFKKPITKQQEEQK